MKFYLISIFPDIFDSFLKTSLISKSIEKKFLTFEIVNPRDFAIDKHKQIDDEIYWWWVGMLMKAKPIIDSVEHIIDNIIWTYKIIFLSPSKIEFNQKLALEYSKLDNIILINGRYEWIDYRCEKYLYGKFWDNFEKVSIWKYVLLWWEVASMVLIESIWRLIPWVIKEDESWKDESYINEDSENNIFLEYPQYTRPEKLMNYDVPKVLLSWNHSEIKKRKEKNKKII